jgi:hypothetical protein
MVPSGTASGGKGLFTCGLTRRYGQGCEGHPSLGVNRIEDAVRAAVAAWAEDVDAAARDAARRAARHDGAAAVGRLEAVLAGHEKNLLSMARQRAADAEAGGILGDDVWRRAAEEARAERDQAAAELGRARREAARQPAPEAVLLMTGLVEGWDEARPDALNRVLRNLVRRVTVYREGEKVRGPEGWWRLMPARIEVLPVWEPDPWEGNVPVPGKAMKIQKGC